MGRNRIVRSGRVIAPLPAGGGARSRAHDDERTFGAFRRRNDAEAT